MKYELVKTFGRETGLEPSINAQPRNSSGNARGYSTVSGYSDICPKASLGCVQARNQSTFDEVCSRPGKYVACAAASPLEVPRIGGQV